MALNTRKLGVYTIMGFLLVGLVGFGGTSLVGTTTTVAKVGDRSVGMQEYYNALTSQINNFSRQTGTPLNLQQAQAFGLDQMVLNTLVEEKALENELLRVGISTGDARVAETIRGMQQFTALDGSFDREAYRTLLRNQGMNETGFEENIRLALARELIDGAVRASTGENRIYGDTLANWRGETRDILWATVSRDSLSTEVTPPTDADLEAFYTASPDRYTLPERRNFSYAWVTPTMLVDDVYVDEADIKALYDSRIGEYVMPERRLVERMVYGDEAAASAALARVTAGEATFEDLVEARGLRLQDADMGDVAIGDLGAAGEAVFAADVGAVVGPLPTSLGPALFRVNAVLDAQETTLDEVAEDLRAELALQRAERMIVEQNETYVDMLAGGASVEEMAEATDLELGSIAWYEGVTSDIAAYEAFRTAAQSAASDDFPELLPLEDGGAFVLRLDSVIPPTLQPFDEVKDRVAEDFIASAQAQAIANEAQLIAALVETEGFDADGLTLTPTEAPTLRRTDFLEGTPPDFVRTAFELAEGQVAVLPTEDGAILLQVQSITPADRETPAVTAEADQIAREAQQGIDADIYNTFMGAIRAETSITIDQAALTALYAQIP